jgi:hypothetical protein
MKLAMGMMILLSGHHFMHYAAAVASGLDKEIRRLEDEQISSNELVAT